MARPKITSDRISKNAAKKYPLTNGNDLETGKRIGCIAGATAQAERAQKLVEALGRARVEIEALNKRVGLISTPTLMFIDDAIQQWAGKEVEKEPKSLEPQPDLGICKECKTRPATTDYNGHQYYVCKLCDDSLNREFDEEYK